MDFCEVLQMSERKEGQQKLIFGDLDTISPKSSIRTMID